MATSNKIFITILLTVYSNSVYHIMATLPEKAEACVNEIFEDFKADRFKQTRQVKLLHENAVQILRRDYLASEFAIDYFDIIQKAMFVNEEFPLPKNYCIDRMHTDTINAVPIKNIPHLYDSKLQAKVCKDFIDSDEKMVIANNILLFHTLSEFKNSEMRDWSKEYFYITTRYIKFRDHKSPTKYCMNKVNAKSADQKKKKVDDKDAKNKSGSSTSSHKRKAHKVSDPDYIQL